MKVALFEFMSFPRRRNRTCSGTWFVAAGGQRKEERRSRVPIPITRAFDHLQGEPDRSSPQSDLNNEVVQYDENNDVGGVSGTGRILVGVMAPMGKMPVEVTMVVGRISLAYAFLQSCRELQQVLFNKTPSLAFVEISSNEGEFTINPRTRTSSSSSS